MSNTINLYDPRTMMAAIEQMPPVRTFFRDTFFTNEQTFPTDAVDVDYYKGKRRVAPFVHQKIGGKTVENIGYSTKSYKPQLVAPDKITAADDLAKRMAGEPLYGGMTPAQRAAQQIGRDLAELNEMIARREEVMAAQVMEEGKITVKGEGLDEEIDFSFDNETTIGVKWDASASTPIADLEDEVRDIRKDGFVNPNICVMAKDAADAFLAHEDVQNILDNRRIDLGTIDPSVLPNGITYLGRLNKLGLDIYQYDEWYLDDWTTPGTATEKPMWPDKKVLIASTQAMFSRMYAAVTIIDEDTQQFVTVEASRVPDSWIAKKPARRFIQVQAKPLMVPHEVDSWAVLTVLS